MLEQAAIIFDELLHLVGADYPRFNLTILTSESTHTQFAPGLRLSRPPSYSMSSRIWSALSPIAARSRCHCSVMISDRICIVKDKKIVRYLFCDDSNEFVSAEPHRRLQMLPPERDELRQHLQLRLFFYVTGIQTASGQRSVLQRNDLRPHLEGASAKPEHNFSFLLKHTSESAFTRAHERAPASRDL